MPLLPCFALLAGLFAAACTQQRQAPCVCTDYFFAPWADSLATALKQPAEACRKRAPSPFLVQTLKLTRRCRLAVISDSSLLRRQGLQDWQTGPVMATDWLVLAGVRGSLPQDSFLLAVPSAEIAWRERAMQAIAGLPAKHIPAIHPEQLVLYPRMGLTAAAVLPGRYARMQGLHTYRRLPVRLTWVQVRPQ